VATPHDLISRDFASREYWHGFRGEFLLKEGVARSDTAASGGDDVWIPTTCSLCYGTCAILAHRVDGVLVKIEGNPDSAVGKGKLCGKGVSGIATHYDPNRLTRPLRSTNPKKGLDEDPRWKEISWDEALDEIAQVLKCLRKDDPRKLLIQRTTTVLAGRNSYNTFGAAFGTPNISTAGGGRGHGAAGRIRGERGALPAVVPETGGSPEEIHP